MRGTFGGHVLKAIDGYCSVSSKRGLVIPDIKGFERVKKILFKSMVIILSQLSGNSVSFTSHTL